MRVPLAWLNLIHEPSRLMVAIAGVSFAVLLVFMNLGFLGALATTASQFYTRLNGQVFLISPPNPGNERLQAIRDRAAVRSGGH